MDSMCPFLLPTMLSPAAATTTLPWTQASCGAAVLALGSPGRLPEVGWPGHIVTQCADCDELWFHAPQQPCYSTSPPAAPMPSRTPLDLTHACSPPWFCFCFPEWPPLRVAALPPAALQLEFNILGDCVAIRVTSQRPPLGCSAESLHPVA